MIGGRSQLHPEVLTEVVFPGDRVIDEFLGRAFEDDAAVVDEECAVGDGMSLSEIRG